MNAWRTIGCAATSVLLAGCLYSSSSRDESRPPVYEPVFTKHLELYNVMGDQPRWYETFVQSVEDWSGKQMPRMRLYQHFAPPGCARPYCIDDGMVTVVCDDLRRECMAALSAALVDEMGAMPLLFRESLVELLAGGIGHGDVFYVPLDRTRLDVDAMLMDRTYLEAKQRVEAAEWGGIEWTLAVHYPAGDLARFIIDTLGPRDGIALLRRAADPAAWEQLGGRDAALKRWRASRAVRGRMFRLPLTECSTAYRISSGDNSPLPVLVQGILHVPDLDYSMSRFGVGNFELEEEAEVSVSVMSSVHGNPFFRVEPCSGADPGPFFNMGTNIIEHTATASMELPAGRYFVVAGSFGFDVTLDEAETPESLSIAVEPGS